MITDYYDGGDLGDYYAPLPLRPLRQVLQVADQVLEGLGSVPGRAHGDLKPPNIVIEKVQRMTLSGLSPIDVPQIRLIDWDQSRVYGHISSGLAGQESGTPLWRSPEQYRGEAFDVRSDLYSLGALLYWMISGHWPYELDVNPQTPVTPGQQPAVEVVEAEVERIRSAGTRPEDLHNLMAHVPPSVALAVNLFLSYAPDRRMPGVDLRDVIYQARDLVGALNREVEQRVRSQGEIMVGTV